MAAYQKNTGSQHPLIGGILTLSKRDTGHGSVPLTDYYAYLWYGTISIGTPAEEFTGVTFFLLFNLTVADPVTCIVDFDTGSSDLFVPSTSCDSTCSGHNLYEPSDDSHDLGKKFALAYADGSTVSGEEYSDDVTIAGLVVRRATFSSLLPQSAYTSHRRRRTSRSPLQHIILQGFKPPSSLPTA